jgi:Domain of unknown function (DUF4136)
MITQTVRRMNPPGHIVLLIAVLANVAAATAAPKVKIRTQADKTFSFQNLRTWDWHPDGAGEVKLMTTAMDAERSKQVHATLDPIITQAVEKELSARGFERKPGGADFIVNYYVLTVPGTASNEMGQFLPSVAEYGLPPIKQATTMLRAFERGSLVLDVISPAKKSVVWRGIAETEVDRELPDDVRKARIEKAVQDIVKKLPVK